LRGHVRQETHVGSEVSHDILLFNVLSIGSPPALLLTCPAVVKFPVVQAL